MTGKEIVDSWHEQKEFKAFRNITEKPSFTDLEKRIDEALGKARTEGEIAGAERMVEVVRKTMV